MKTEFINERAWNFHKKSSAEKKIKAKHLVNHLTANHATQHVQSLAGDVKSLSVAVCIHELNYYGRVI